MPRQGSWKKRKTPPLFTKSLLLVLHEMRHKITDLRGLGKVFSIQDTEDGTDDENHKSQKSKTYLNLLEKGFQLSLFGFRDRLRGKRGTEMIYTGKRERYVYSERKMFPQKAGNTMLLVIKKKDF